MPIVTRIIISLNIFIHLYITYLTFGSPEEISSFYEKFGLVPIAFIEGKVYQPITSLFLHYPYFPLHLLVNMIGLWSFGSMLERQIGSLKFFWLYFISGLFSSLFVIIIPFLFGTYQTLTQPTVGASGALMGLLGAVSVLYPNSKLLLLFFPMKTRTAAIIIAVGSILLAIFDPKSFISHNGHLGGLLGGIIYALFALKPEFDNSNLIEKKNKLFENINKAKYNIRTIISNTTHIDITDKEIKLIDSDYTKNENIDSIKQNEIIEVVDNSISNELENNKDSNEQNEKDETKVNKKLVYDPVSGKFILE